MGKNAQPQWNKHIQHSDAKILFAELPVGWHSSCHENPEPQWILPLSGKWHVETMDGQHVEMGVGEVSFGGDQKTKPDRHGHQGHISGTIGQQAVMLMIVQVICNEFKERKQRDFS